MKVAEASSPTEEKTLSTSTWPPQVLPRKRRRHPAALATLISVVLALLLVVSGSLLLIFVTTRGYAHALTRVANIEAQQTRSVVSTAQAKAQGTQRAINQAQSAIEATATAQAEATAQATSIVANASATATVSQDLLSLWTQNSPKLSDPLSNNQGSNGQWDEGGANSYVGCAFQNGTYTASENQLSYLQPCIAQNTSFGDFAYQASMTFQKGNHAQAGLIFRIGSSNDSYYFLYFSPDGSYGLDRYDQTGNGTSLRSGTSDAINTGIDATNQITVIANKDQFTFFANNQYLDTVTDNTTDNNTIPSNGKIGVAVVDNDTPAQVAFSNAQVWQYKTPQDQKQHA